MSDTAREDLLDRVIAGRQQYFGEFYRGELRHFARQLDLVLRQTEDIPIDRDEVLAAALTELLDEFIAIGSRAVIFNFQSGDAPQFDAFVRDLADGRTALILEQYPVLARLLRDGREARVRLIQTALGRLRADMPLLLAVRLWGTAPLTSVGGSGGDLHNGGKKVLILRAADGGAVAYKPRPLAADVFVASLIEQIGAFLAPDDRLVPPISLERDGYGWQEIVRRLDCATVDEVQAFHRRLGVAAALFAALGSTDLHFENIIASGSMPKFFDLETLAQFRTNVTSDGLLQSALSLEFSSSVLSTMLFPARLEGSALDMNMAGLGDPSNAASSSWRTFAVVDAGTEDIRFEQQPTLLEHGDNLVRRDGIAIDSAQFGDEMRAGYRAGMDAILAARVGILHAIASARVGGMPVRQVLRPTAVYARFLEAATHPLYLEAEEDRDRLLAKLGDPRRLPEGVASRVAAAEQVALRRGDVPYFWAAFGETSLESIEDVPVPDVVPQSLAQQVRDDLTARLDEVDRNEYYIQASLVTTATDPWLRSGRPSLYLLEQAPVENLHSYAKFVGDTLTNLAVWNERKTECAWLTPMISAEGPLRWGMSDLSLYQGGGIPLFLADLGAVTGNENYLNLAVAAMRGIASARRGSLAIQTDPSAFSGAAGHLFVARRVAQLSADAALRDFASELEQDLLVMNPFEWPSDDYVGGLAGTAVIAAQLSRLGVASDWELLLAGIGDRLESAIRAGGNADDLAHGRAGIATGLAHVAAVQGDGRRMDLAVSTARGLLTTSDDSWCKGRTGVIAAQLDILSVAGHGDEALEIAANWTPPLPDSADLCLCHGSAGIAMTIREVDIALGRGPGRAEEHLLTTLQLAVRNGYGAGLANGAGLLTYFLGHTGVAHAALITGHPELASPMRLSIKTGIRETVA